MRIEVDHRPATSASFRSARVRSLYNVEAGDGEAFRRVFDLPLEERPWRIGLVVGPSGSGKSSIGPALGDVCGAEPWPDAPVIDAVGGSPDDAAGALAAAGLGSVPAWLRPYRVLSGGERFRCDLARLLLAPSGPRPIVYDEFTSVVDRRVAQVGALAFAKAFRRRPEGQFVALSCHYDVEGWLAPDWVLDTSDGSFRWGSVRRPPIELRVCKGTRRVWPYFEEHHYLKANYPPCKTFVGLVDEAPVVHLSLVRADSGHGRGATYRWTRLVVAPEWQGCGVGLAFLEALSRAAPGLAGEAVGALSIQTSHPGLIAALARRSTWARRASAVASVQGSAGRGYRGTVAGGPGRPNLRGISSFRWVGGFDA